MHADYGRRPRRCSRWFALVAGLLFLAAPSLTRAQPKPNENTSSSYDQIAPVLLGKGSFQEVMAKDKADKPAVMTRQQKLLAERYDLASRHAARCRRKSRSRR